MVRRRRRNPAATCEREPKLRCDAHHQLRLPVCEAQIGGLHGITGRRFHHRPIFLDLYHCLRPQGIRPAIVASAPRSKWVIKFSFDNSAVRRLHSGRAVGLSSGGQSGAAGSGLGSCGFRGRSPGLPVKAFILDSFRRATGSRCAHAEPARGFTDLSARSRPDDQPLSLELSRVPAIGVMEHAGSNP